jgi:hypothetical protein
MLKKFLALCADNFFKNLYLISKLRRAKFLFASKKSLPTKFWNLNSSHFFLLLVFSSANPERLPLITVSNIHDKYTIV